MTLYILDSDHLSLHQQGHEPLWLHLSTTLPEQITITVVSVEELVRGRLAQIRRAERPEEQIKAYYWLGETLDFLCNFTVLRYDPRAQAHFETFRAQKIRIGTQDLRIAAIALSQDATLVTRNRRDFEAIPSLKIEDWSLPPA